MNDEWTLAEQLKNECDSAGVEVFPKESAKILHKIGLQYKRKSPDKQSLIQSVALMTSAIIREPDNVDEIKQDLNQTWLHVLQLANAKQPHFQINTFVEKVQNQVILMRNGTKEKLEALEKIPDILDESELVEKQTVKIKNIEAIQKLVSDNYIKTMKGISDECLKILGNAPCRFSLVGMGSLARNEITPYSDFESILVLEEEIQLRSDYSEVLEYFRWFSTIFQIILVRLGETILRFLAIPCLNNPSDRKHNWFYDDYTPCGICPDGFAPPACKNPLGRQTPTPNKPWTTELIKPVSEMVKYLDSEEDLKNGYHLSDILMKTCFVAGDESIHQDFCSKVDVALSEQSQRQICSILNEINKDLKLYQFRGEYLFPKSLSRDIKRLMYRSISVFISALGRLFGIKKSSCFEILNEMARSEWISLSDCRKLMFAFAVACEARLRFYTAQKEQSDSMSRWNLFEGQTMENAIGQKSLIDAFVTIWCFHNSMEQFMHQNPLDRYLKFQAFKPKFSLQKPPLYLPARFCCHLGFLRTAEDLCLKISRKQNAIPTEEVAQLLLVYTTAMYNSGRVAEAVRILKKNLPGLRKAKCVWFLCAVYLKISVCNKHLGRHKEAMKYLRKLNFYHFFGFLNMCFYTLTDDIGQSYERMGRYKKALKYFDRVLQMLNSNPAHDYNQHYQKIMDNKLNCLLALGQHDEAQKITTQNNYNKQQINLKESLKTCSLFSKHVEKGESNFGNVFCDSLENVSDSVRVLQSEWESLQRELVAMDMKNTDDDYKQFLLLEDFLKKAELHASGKNFVKFCYLSLTTIALRIQRYEDAVIYGIRALHELETSLTDDSYTNWAAEKKGELAQACLCLKNYKDALPLLLDPRVRIFRSTNKEYDKFYHQLRIARCYTELKEHHKALEYYRRGFSLKTKMFTHEMKLNGLSRKEATLKLIREYKIHICRSHMIGCLLTLKRYDEALYHSKQMWSAVSQLDWVYESAEKKIEVLANLAQCHYYAGKNNDHTLKCASEGLRLALEVYENPLAHEATLVIVDFLIKTWRKIPKAQFTWAYGYSPSIYSHFIDTLLDTLKAQMYAGI